MFISVKERIEFLLLYVKMGPKEFGKRVGVSQPLISILKGGSRDKISSELAEKITECYPEISAEWLLWGRGQMLIPQPPPKKYGDVGSDAGMVGEPDVLEIKLMGIEKRVKRLEEIIKACNESHIK
jgi:hypothetical protein